MTVTAVRKDPDRLTMTIEAQFDVSAERAWQLWSDPRQLERWWGPPTYPATFVEHELVPGGTISYYMTGPEGDQHRGWWRVREVEAPRRLTVEDGFANEAGAVDDSMPITVMRVTIEDRPQGGVSMTIESQFASLAGMEQLIAMGMEEGITLAVGQIDAILAD
jgi:uncharacterized protein YndB with AHSA1/START domain